MVAADLAKLVEATGEAQRRCGWTSTSKPADNRAFGRRAATGCGDDASRRSRSTANRIAPHRRHRYPLVAEITQLQNGGSSVSDRLGAFIALATVIVPFALSPLFGCNTDPVSKTDLWTAPPPKPASCGDGRVQGDEACDGTELAGKDCQSFGFPEGELRCNDACTGYLVRGCRGVPSWTGTSPDPCNECGPGETCDSGVCRPLACEGNDRPESEARKVAGAFDVSLVPVDVTVQFPSELPSVESNGDEPLAGTLEFRRKSGDTDTEFEVPLGGSHKQTIDLAPGVYDIWWSAWNVDGFPDHAVALKRDLRVEQERSVSLSVPKVVRLSGRVDVTYRDEPVAGSLLLQSAQAPPTKLHHPGDRDGEGMSPLAIDRPVYRGVPLRAEFVAKESSIVSEDDDRILHVPPVLLEERFSLDEGGSVDWSGQLHDVEARLLLNGRRPDTEVYHTRLSLQMPQDGDDYRTTLERQQSATVRAIAPTGRYRLVGTLRFGNRVLREASRIVTFDGTGPLELDIKFPTARLTVDVSDYPESTTEDDHAPRLSLYKPDGRLVEHVHDDAAKKASKTATTFQIRVPSGTYDVYAGPSFRVDGHLSGEKLVRRGVEVNGDTELKADLNPVDAPPPADLAGEVTVNGEPFFEVVSPDPTDDRDRNEELGNIRFTTLAGPQAGNDISVETRRDGSHLRYRAEVPPGAYRVRYTSPAIPADWCTLHMNGTLVGPHYVLHPRLEVTGDVRRDLDLQATRVHGRITDDGEPPAAVAVERHRQPSKTQRGSVGLQPYAWQVDHPKRGGCGTWGSPASQELPLEGPPTYSFHVIPGHYRLGARLDSGVGHLVDSRRVTGPELRHDFDFKFTEIDARVTVGGQPWSFGSSEGRRLRVEADTPVADSRLELAADGGISGRMLGAPSLWLEILENHGIEDERLPRPGRYLLREECGADR